MTKIKPCETKQKLFNMKDDGKYYTPTIEEFHVGFEFQGFADNGWEDENIRDWRELSTVVDRYSHTASFRVKHLDRDCIESLEWLYTGKGVANWYNLRGEFEIGNWTAYEAVMIHDPSCNWIKIHVLDRGDEVEIFQGEIKNKSELKRLMQWLKLS